MIVTWLAIWILLLVIFFMHRFSADSKQIAGGSQGLYNNLGYPPITDIAFASSCPGDYTELELGYWPGTDESCHNSLLDELIDLITDESGSCLNHIPKTEPQTYTKWKGQSICAKRATKYTNSSTFCPAGYTKCSQGMCVYGSTCPITWAAIEDAPLENTETTGSTQLLDRRYLNYKREQGKQPIALFTLTQGEGTPCISTHEYPKQKNYHSVSEEAHGCKKYGTFPDFKVIDNDTSLNSFQSQWWSRPVLTLPKFNQTISQQSAYLTYSTQIKLRDTPHCNSMNLEGLVYASTHAKIAAATSTIILIIEFLFLLGVTYLYIKLSPSERIQKAFGFLNALSGVIGVLAVIASILLWKQETRVSSAKGDVYAITERDCFYDSSVNKIFHELHSKFGLAPRILGLWIAEAVICALSLVSIILVNEFHSRR